MDRVASLKQILEQNPNDSFARYGLAMEYARDGKVDAALAEFQTLLAANPEYVPAYQMAGQMLASERPQEACQFLQQGIAVARQTGNAHARAEMEALLQDLAQA
jgi:cytochrome c-type biogenesis protein CcmH/NrfG